MSLTQRLGKRGRFAKVSRGDKMEEHKFPFEELAVWQDSINLADYVLILLAELKQNNNTGLIKKMGTTVVALSQNIAESKAYESTSKFIERLYVARGSLFKIVALNRIFEKRSLFTKKQARKIRAFCEDINCKLEDSITSLKGTKKEKPVRLSGVARECDPRSTADLEPEVTKELFRSAFVFRN